MSTITQNTGASLVSSSQLTALSSAVQELKEDGPKSNLEIDISEVKIEKKIGAGAFGTVFLAKYNDELVAIKKFNFANLDAQQILEFTNEVKILALG